jgi:hypothetical protein
MLDSIEEETKSPVDISRLFRAFESENVMVSRKGKVVFHPEVISDMHE